MGIIEQIWQRTRWGKMSGKIIWLTGLSGSGKTTIAKYLVKYYKKRNYNVILLNGDIIRNIFNTMPGLGGFSKEERDAHIKRVGYTATLLANERFIVICALISPNESSREAVRKMCKDFVLVYVHATLDTCIERDPKGLYKRAIAGEIKNFTGIDQPYEVPKNPSLLVATDHNTVKDCAHKIINYVREMKW
jgi:adenylylsulfate kinase